MEEKVKVKKNLSWACGVKTDGDLNWVTNGLRFVTESEAENYGRDLDSRWLVRKELKSLETPDKPNTLFHQGKSISFDDSDCVLWAFKTIVHNQNAPALNYAVEYAKYELICPEDELKIQAIYVLGNISRWNCDDGKKCRAILKAFTKNK